MHIVYVSTQFVSITLTGGLGNHLLRMGLSLVEMGHRPTIMMISDRDETEEYRGIQLVRVSGKRTALPRRLLAGTVHANAYQSKRFRAALRSLHAREPIDIVQYTNYRATALYREPSIPAVMRISSYRPLWDPLHPSASQSMKRRHAARLETRSFYSVDGIFAPSRVLAEAIRRDTGMSVEVIEPPFLMDEPKRDTSLLAEMAGKRPFFFFAGSLTRRKGAEAIAEAIYPLLSKYTEHRFLFIGKTENEAGQSTLDAVRAAAGDHADRVLHHPPVHHGKLYPFYEQSSLVILPSIIDNIANTALEAMSLGAIVVGTDGGSFEQLITDGQNGFLCKPGDADSLLLAIDRAEALSQVERQRIGRRAQERIAKLSPDRKIPELLSYYYRIIEEHRVRAPRR
jgi:glycosyltransferase involved in cell wall biosynthesis